MQNNSTYRLFEDKVDKLVHDKLSNQHIDVPSMEWDSLQQRLAAHQANKPKKSKSLLLVLCLLLMIGSGIYFYNTQTQQTPTIANNTNTNNITTKTEANAIAANQSTTTITPNAEHTIITPNTTSTVANLSNNSIANANTTNVVNQRSNNNNYQKTITTTYNTDNNKKKENRDKKTKTNVSNNALDNIMAAENTIAAETTPKKERKIELSTEKSYPDNHVEKTNTTETTTVAPTANDETTTTSVVKEIDNAVTPTPADNTKAITTEDYTTTVNPVAKKTKKNRVRNNREMPEHDFVSQKQWYVEAFSGFNNSIKHKNSFAAFLAPAGYTNKRLNQESALGTLQAGINFKMRKNHLLLSGGLSYIQLGDRINYDSSNIGSLVQQVNNRTSFTYLEVPIIAGYEIANKRWGLSLQGGVSAGLLMGLSGQYVSINNFSNQLFDVKTNKTTFKKSIFNVVLNPQVNYFVNSKMNLFVSPVYRRNLQPITVADANMKQKYNSFGINIGIRTKLY